MDKEQLVTMIKEAVAPLIPTGMSDEQMAIVRAEIEAKVKSHYENLPDIAEMKKLRQKQEDEENSKFKSLGEQLSAIAKASFPGASVDERLTKAPSGMNEGVGSQGGFLLQPEFATELFKLSHETGILSKKTKKVPIGTNSNSLVINAIDETSRVTGSRWGGVNVYWVDEGDTVAATKPKFRRMELKLHKMMGIYYATEELLQDTTALGSIVMQAFSEEFGFKNDDAILNGKGGGQPLGIMNSGALISIAKEVGQAAATIVAENVEKMWVQCYAPNRRKAEWYINQDCETQLWGLYKAIGVGGIPLYLPPAGYYNQAPDGQLLGRPVNVIEQCQTLGTLGDIILADLGDYVMIEKRGIVASDSVHVRFLYDEMTFKFTYRVDGQPLWNAPLTPANGTNTLSPFVALASRA